MQTREELEFTATRFLEIVESYLDQGKKNFGMDVSMALPLSQADFDRTVEALELINKLGKDKGIHAEINDKEKSSFEYGHTRVIKFERI